MFLGLNEYTFKGINYIKESLSGLTVAIALVPEAIAFSLMAGVPVLVGLYAAFMMGLVTSLLGGRPGMISGATGAVAVVIAPLVHDHGKEEGLIYILLTVILAGLIQMLVGSLKLGKFIRLVPHSVMLGFVNGLAIVIFLAQFAQFHKGGNPSADWLVGKELYTMVALVLFTMLIMFVWPKIGEKVKALKVMPSGLLAILVIAGVVIGFGINTPTVGDLSSIKGAFPTPDLPASSYFSLETLKIIFPFALSVAGVGLIESLLTLNLIDELTETRGNGNREAFAQGLGNVLSGLFGGMGGCAMIGQSMININSGSRARTSGIIASVALILFVVALSTVIEQLPVAVLVGIMFMVAIGTFEWSSLRLIKKIPKTDLIVIIVVSVVTVVKDLAIAVLIGVIMSTLAFAWENAVRIRARKKTLEDGTKVYEVFGPLFFGSTKAFMDKFTPKEDPAMVVVDFSESRISDQSALECVRKLNDLYKDAGKEVQFRKLSKDCVRILDKAKINVIEAEDDPKYNVMVDAEDIH